MGYTLVVKNPCRCFMRDGGVETQTFGSSAQAKEEAEILLARMEKNYCKKHRFTLAQTAGSYIITITPRVAG